MKYYNNILRLRIKPKCNAYLCSSTFRASNVKLGILLTVSHCTIATTEKQHEIRNIVTEMIQVTHSFSDERTSLKMEKWCLEPFSSCSVLAYYGISEYYNAILFSFQGIYIYIYIYIYIVRITSKF